MELYRAVGQSDLKKFGQKIELHKLYKKVPEEFREKRAKACNGNQEFYWNYKQYVSQIP